MGLPSRVRIVGRSDEDEVMAVCRHLHQENGMFEMDDNCVRAMLQRAFDRQGGILGAIGLPGRIEALIYILVSTFWYSRQPHLEELFLYVLPEYRKSRHAIDLMRFAKWCSKESELPLVIGVLSTQQTEEKVKLYQRQFKKPVGNFFFYEAKQDLAVA